MKLILSFIVLSLLGVFAASSPTMAQDAPKPPELKVLERLIGKWDSESVSRAAEWTPKEVRAKGVLNREWVLDGRYVQETSKQSDGDAMVMFTYDSAKRAYRSWLFNTQGHNIEVSGQYDEKSQTLTCTSDVGNGLLNTTTIQFIDLNTHQWTAVVKDKNGKIYFDAEGTCTRQK